MVGMPFFFFKIFC